MSTTGSNPIVKRPYRDAYLLSGKPVRDWVAICPLCGVQCPVFAVAWCRPTRKQARDGLHFHLKKEHHTTRRALARSKVKAPDTSWPVP